MTEELKTITTQKLGRGLFRKANKPIKTDKLMKKQPSAGKRGRGDAKDSELPVQSKGDHRPLVPHRYETRERESIRWHRGGHCGHRSHHRLRIRR